MRSSWESYWWLAARDDACAACGRAPQDIEDLCEPCWLAEQENERVGHEYEVDSTGQEASARSAPGVPLAGLARVEVGSDDGGEQCAS